MRSLFCFVFVVACSDSGSTPDAKPPDVNIGACGAIGSACGNGCPSGFECINNACAPMHGSCGGFVGAVCQDATLTCTYPASSSAGICLRPDEKDCMCAIAPTALSDCPEP
jgi:hypothetical protein